MAKQSLQVTTTFPLDEGGFPISEKKGIPGLGSQRPGVEISQDVMGRTQGHCESPPEMA